MRILFAGTPALAVPSLEKLARSHTIVAVLTSPDQPAGRGRSCLPSPVKEAALSLGLRVLQPARLDAAFLDEARSLGAEALVVAAYGKIFRQAFLDLFPGGGINLHPSLLPKLRGPSPISASILSGDAETGVTVQRIALKFDTGDILGQTRVALRGEETTASLSGHLASVGAELLAEVLSQVDAGRPPAPVRQREEDATYCHPLRKEDGAIDWREPAVVLERKVRAYDPWPRAATTFRGQTCLLLKSHLYTGTLAHGETETEPAPGAVLAADPAHGLLAATGAGILAVERLQLQFKKPTDWRSFLNGHPDIVGSRLGA